MINCEFSIYVDTNAQGNRYARRVRESDVLDIDGLDAFYRSKGLRPDGPTGHTYRDLKTRIEAGDRPVIGKMVCTLKTGVLDEADQCLYAPRLNTASSVTGEEIHLIEERSEECALNPNTVEANPVAVKR